MLAVMSILVDGHGCPGRRPGKPPGGGGRLAYRAGLRALVRPAQLHVLRPGTTVLDTVGRRRKPCGADRPPATFQRQLLHGDRGALYVIFLIGTEIATYP